MNGRIEVIQRTSDVVDGRKKQVDTPYYSCFCEISDLFTNEQYTALQTKLEDTVVFKVRRCKKINDMRGKLKEFIAIWQGEEFKVYAMQPDTKDENWIRLKANRNS